ncbi:MAG: transmembrane permease [Flavobacteriaceae bacterium]|nr:MAG: transmembrane permease [Flavobacteriaceae bacterium]
MNYELFLAKRMIAGREHKSSISSPIIKISILAIALGMIVMMISMSTSFGLQEKIREKLSGFNGHVQITSFDDNLSGITLNPIDKDQDFYPEFISVEGVSNVQVFATKPGVILTDKTFEGIVFKGVSADYDWSFIQSYIEEGVLPIYSTEKSNAIVMSSVMANNLEVKVGDTLRFHFPKNDPNKRPNFRMFNIVALYDSGFDDFDNSIIIGDINHIIKMNKWKEDEVGGFEIFIDDFDEIRTKSNEIYVATPSTLNARSILEKYPQIFDWINLFDVNVYLIIGIMIVIAGINMITALLVLILERAKMIGILKTLGSTNGSLQKMFLYNASYIIIKGLFWGNLIGLTLLFTQQYFGIIALDPSTYYVKEVPVHLDWLFIGLLNIGTLVLCLTMLVVPTMVISKIDPVKSIKFD